MINKSGIYLITCKANQRKYVGSAVNFRKRFNEHTYDLVKGVHHNPPLQRCWNKYGAANFVFSILEIVEDKESLSAREQFWVDAIHPELNVSTDVVAHRLGVKETQATKDKKSKSKKRQWALLTEKQK